ncbi:MAG: hypothetical protein ABI693_06940 [Bryobacteraceae bacterium]
MSIRSSRFLLCSLPIVFLAAQDLSWKGKPPSQWTEAEAQSILSDSPWSKETSPAIDRTANGRRSSGGMGRVGVGMGGMGGPRMGGRGGGMGRNPSQTDPGADGSGTSRTPAPNVTVRWESALPVQEAHLKLADSNAPSIDEASYTIAVTGLPRRLINGDDKDIEKHLKSAGELKRAGKKTIHSTEAEVIEKDSGPVILFKFPRSAEIVKNDGAVEFTATIGSAKLAQSFSLLDMLFNGKLEL